MTAFSQSRKSSYALYGFFCLALAINILFWSHARTLEESWDNVPSAPDSSYAALMGIGDAGLAYRLTGYFLQNFGNTGGRFEMIDTYDFSSVEEWLFVAHALDPLSDYVPFMAAYFLGATEIPENNAHLVPYLRAAGKVDAAEKWRWLAQAVYKARYKMEDVPYALEMAEELAALPGDVAPWGRQMPAFINLQLGNKEAAYGIMLHMLQSEGSKLHPVEVMFMKDFICTRTLDPQDAAQNALCQTTE